MIFITLILIEATENVIPVKSAKTSSQIVLKQLFNLSELVKNKVINSTLQKTLVRLIKQTSTDILPNKNSQRDDNKRYGEIDLNLTDAYKEFEFYRSVVILMRTGNAQLISKLTHGQKKFKESVQEIFTYLYPGYYYDAETTEKSEKDSNMDSLKIKLPFPANLPKPKPKEKPVKRPSSPHSTLRIPSPQPIFQATIVPDPPLEKLQLPSAHLPIKIEPIISPENTKLDKNDPPFSGFPALKRENCDNAETVVNPATIAQPPKKLTSSEPVMEIKFQQHPEPCRRLFTLGFGSVQEVRDFYCEYGEIENILELNKGNCGNNGKRKKMIFITFANIADAVRARGKKVNPQGYEGRTVEFAKCRPEDKK